MEDGRGEARVRPPRKPPAAEGENGFGWRPLATRLGFVETEAPEPDPAPPAPEPELEASPEPQPEPQPKPESRPPGRDERDSPQALLRRLRSLLPVSPLPWHWHRRISRGMVLAIAALLAGGAIASVLIQRGASDEAESAPKLAASGPVRQQLEGLKLREKATLVVLAGVADGSAPELGRASPGGYLIGPEDWAAGGARLVKRLRGGGGADAPLIVGRQEGGIYRSYLELPPRQRQIEIGDSGDPARAERAAAETGTALKGAGFDLNLAPVADVANLASPIADRAYGDDPGVVKGMTAAAIRGCREASIACAVAHFPGLGGASADTLDGPATVSLDADSLKARDLAPFRAAFAAGAEATVVSLAFYAAYDPTTPAALSSAVVSDLLRDRLGFKGVAITDDLTSGAITAGVGSSEAAVQALAAGSDLAMVDGRAAAVAARDAILAAARSGALSRDRLDEAAARVLALKRRLADGDSK